MHNTDALYDEQNSHDTMPEIRSEDYFFATLFHVVISLRSGSLLKERSEYSRKQTVVEKGHTTNTYKQPHKQHSKTKMSKKLPLVEANEINVPRQKNL